MKNFLIVLLMVAIVAGTGYGVYYEIQTYKKEHWEESPQNKVEENEEKDKNESLPIEGETVSQLMKPIHYLNDGLLYDHEDSTYFGYWYQKEKYTVDTISNQVKLYLSLYSLYDPEWQNQDIIEVTKTEVEKSLENLFGKITVEHESLKGVGCGYTHFTYEGDKEIYSQENKICGAILPPHYTSKIKNATKYNDRIEIIEQIAYIDYETEGDNEVTKIHKNQNEVEIATIEEEISDDQIFTQYGEQLDSYKYTFQYQNGKYHFYSIEKIK